MSEIKKDFDCVEMKNNIQKKIYEETKHMTLEQFLRHCSKSAENSFFSEKLKEIRLRQKEEFLKKME